MSTPLSLDYLFSCSALDLQDIELKALDRASRALKSAKVSWQEAATELANAEIARYFRLNRTRIMEEARAVSDLSLVLEFPKFPAPAPRDSEFESLLSFAAGAH